jgi:tetratricopeptide (TPR) repeat protein
MTMRLLLLVMLLAVTPASARGSTREAMALWRTMQSDDLAAVIDAGERLKALPRRSMPADLRRSAILRLAEVYEKTADFERAAGTYTLLPQEFPRHEQAISALRTAGDLFARAGRFDEAIAAFERSLGMPYARGRDVPPEVLWKMVLLEEERMNWAAVVSRVDSYLRASPDLAKVARGSSLLHKLGALRRLERQEDVLKCASEILALKLTVEEAALTESRHVRAEAAFALIDPEFNIFASFRFTSIQTFGAELSRALAMKKALEAKYRGVVEAGDREMTIAALVRIASLSTLLAEAVRTAPLPKVFEDIDCCACYMNTDPADEIRDMAVERFELALEQAFRWGIYNEWVLVAVRALESLQPGRLSEERVLPLKVVDTTSSAAHIRSNTAW